MFDNQYSTSTVANEIHLDIQLLLWSLIDTWKAHNIKVDYLQIFELSVINVNGKSIQKIVHRQEVPRHKEEVMFNVYKPISTRVWVVDDGEHAVMMFPSEY